MAGILEHCCAVAALRELGPHAARFVCEFEPATNSIVLAHRYEVGGRRYPIWRVEDGRYAHYLCDLRLMDLRHRFDKEAVAA